ncbi:MULTISPECIES: DAK2 domain-containing protein [Arsenicicoccus]|uniref:DAK2 domain-containing protein n=1 Tax=Arsenicicoccus bolidensis TaxID=229480 RepID=A0ABS9Q016_9MICO|nr:MULTISPECIES: DAK2 domain-containing protein [Arsenicicoccus]MCG7321225.1 DAK2 domain-containing protein [Arsenicicoccus bolidensis]
MGEEQRREPRDPLRVLDRHALRLWAVRSRAALAERREEIDALNVFPVPDGDTGTNMFLTLDSAVERSVAAEPEEELTTFARAAVLGARGNSGVIVSQLVRGLLDVVERPAHHGGADAGVVAQAFRRASDLAYDCVGDPTEGTILTVARSAAEAAEARARQAQATLSAVVDAAVTAARAALDRTPTQLAALRTAGVVDAGASGLVTVLDALKRVVDGGESGPGDPGAAAMEADRLSALAREAHDDGPDVGEDYSGPQHEVMLVLHLASPDGVVALRSSLAALGDSVVVAVDGDLARVHVHADDPDAVLRVADDAGAVSAVTVTDLHAQAAALRESRGTAGAVADQDGPLVVACTDGRGLRELFVAEGALVVPSSPGARASVGAIVDEVQAHPGRPVVLLPNDPDVLLTVTSAADELAAARREVHVVPSRSDVAGLACLAVLDRGAPAAEAAEAMRAVVDEVRSGAVARATRDAATAAGPCRAGDLLGIVEGDIVLVGDAMDEVAVDLVDHLLQQGGELVTLVTAGLSDADVAVVRKHLATRWPDVEVGVHAGGQAAYLLLVGVE